MRFRSTPCLAMWSCICTLASVSIVSAPVAQAQVSAVDAEQLGLEIAWQSQMQVPKTGRGITTSSLWVDNSAPRKYAVVELGAGRTIEISADEGDSKGQPIGIEVAKQMAGERAARLLGKNDGFEVIESTIPSIRLVVATSDGLVQNFDAETGRLLWSSSCGLASAPAHPASLSPHGVSLIHGRHLYLLDWASGKQLQRKELRYGSSIAVAVAGNLAYVTDFQGRLEAYGIGISIKPWTSQINGRVIGPAVSLVDQSFCAFASTDGFVYTMRGGDTPGMWTRYEAASSFSGSIAAGNHAFYAGSTQGVIAKIGVDDQLANQNWHFTTGEALTAVPLVVGPQVYVANESGSLHRIDDATGESKWSQVGFQIVQPLAVAAKKLYCTTLSHELVAIDCDTGRIIAESQPISLVATVINQVSDRLYVSDTAGRLQCLRPLQSTLPRLVEPVQASEAAATEESQPAEAIPTPANNSQDPFNLPTSPASNSDADPFGASSDPFGATSDAEATDADASTADPFGADSDPFGTSN